MLKFEFERRTELKGKACGRLRRQGWVPGALHKRATGEVLPIQLPHDAVLRTQAGIQSAEEPLELKELKSSDEAGQPETYRVCLREVQRHPWKNRLIHVDFYELLS